MYRYCDERPCIICGASLKGMRGDAKFCSDRCRKAATRHAERLNKKAALVVSTVSSLQLWLDDDEHRGAAREHLNLIRSQVDDMLSVT